MIVNDLNFKNFQKEDFKIFLKNLVKKIWDTKV